jgi:hypothetical protein
MFWSMISSNGLYGHPTLAKIVQFTLTICIFSAATTWNEEITLRRHCPVICITAHTE